MVGGNAMIKRIAIYVVAWWPLCTQRGKYRLWSVLVVMGTWTSAEWPCRGKGVWLLDGSSCGEAWGGTMLAEHRCHLPQHSAHWGIRVMYICWCLELVLWSLALCSARVGGSFAPTLSSQRAQDCPWNCFSSIQLLPRLNWHLLKKMALKIW